ncbi:hypothetical protein PHYPSEUDO_015088 [Phytophthora pseudosyringae]|uniref:Uncharacterized protein n=1 Tax=Phytophthora pseudosyringae TaxID=221518 RepID=A0A8T1W448_9STRA|nr:hypothetical protein PHYPSEUDO_015088 [Phytophthora pseudosyringae]
MRVTSCSKNKITGIAVSWHVCCTKQWGKALMLAKVCWIQRLNFSTRAIVSGAPVTISYVTGEGDLFLGKTIFLSSNRQSKNALWWFVSTSPELAGYRIENVNTGERLCVGYEILAGTNAQ